MKNISILKDHLNSYKSRIASNWTMIRIYLVQGDRQESVRQCVRQNIHCLIEIKKINETFRYIREETTREIAA